MRCWAAPRVALKPMPSLRSQLRAQGLLAHFLKEHHPDTFHARYFQCFPPNRASLRVDRFIEKLYNYMDVRAAGCCPDFRLWVSVTTTQHTNTNNLSEIPELTTGGR